MFNAYRSQYVRWIALWLGAIVVAFSLFAGEGRAQESPPPPVPNIPGTAPPDQEAVRKLVEQYLKDQETRRAFEAEQKKEEAAQKKKEADDKGVLVGSNLSLHGVWDNGLFFFSPNKDWRIHIGGRFEFNSVWWNQPQSLQGSATGPGGIPAATAVSGNGLGQLDDGMYFRRVRFRADGTGYEMVEFIEEIDFENINLITFDHLWVGLKNLPLLGTVRIGQHKVPQGVDMYGTDYYLTFLERSVLSEAFLTLFAPGVYVSNNYFDQHVTTHAMFHRLQPFQFYDGAAFGDGDYAFTSRLTWLPLYEGDGACWIHLGGSYQWRRGNLGRQLYPGGTGNAYADSQQVVRFRARAELRDSVGILTPIVGGNAARFVDTGFLMADSVQTICPEFMANFGPFNFRAEAAWAYVDDVRQIFPASAFNEARGNPMFWGGYVQASYFLTGEHWNYDRRFGVYDRPQVNENAFFVRGDDGRLHHGKGAWEVAYRFSHLNLNDNGIDGGILNQHTIGLNWYLNDNTRIQWNYLNIQRSVVSPAVSGTVHALGMQAQWYF